MKINLFRIKGPVFILFFFLLTTIANSQNLIPPDLVTGWATKDITPPQNILSTDPVNKGLTVRDPITCTALAMETQYSHNVADQVIFISCDLEAITDPDLQTEVQKKLAKEIPDFDASKLIISTTGNTSTPQLMQSSGEPTSYTEFLIDQVTNAAVEAWSSRSISSVGWVLGRAVVGYNNRMVMNDGTVVMDQPIDVAKFRTIEGSADSGIELLFVWGVNNALTGVVVNVASPARTVKETNVISADFWGKLRKELKKRFSDDIQVLALCGAAGDQSPVPDVTWPHGRAEQLMLQRKKMGWDQEIANRIADAIEISFPKALANKSGHYPFRHIVKTIQLSRYSRDVDIHVVRLGDVVFATHPFDLFLDYGQVLKGRSQADQTFVIQWTGNYQGLIPSQRAHAHKGLPTDALLPETGASLVDETVEVIDYLWEFRMP
jgi:hypothetical protein